MTILAWLFAVGGVGFAVASFFLLRAVYGLTEIVAEVLDELKGAEDHLQCFHLDENGSVVNATGTRVAMSHMAHTMSALDSETALKLGKANGATATQ